MRKWRGRRPRQKDKSADETDVSQEPFQPAYPEPEEPGLTSADPAEPMPGPVEGSAVPNPSKRSRSRRRRKKGPQAAPEAQPLQPAYTDNAGPRASLSAAVMPGMPTGEAAELAEAREIPETSQAAPAVAPATPPARTPKGAVVLAVGLPGSGKTTWFKRRGVTPLSSDLLRSLLFDSPTEQRHQDLVFSSLRSLLRARLMARMPANYVDATNLTPKERRHWIRMAQDFGYECHAVYFDVPLEVCQERNRRRQRVVPDDVMHRMSAKLRPPTFDEGFSKIIVVRVKHRPEQSEEPAASESEDVSLKNHPTDEP